MMWSAGPNGRYSRAMAHPRVEQLRFARSEFLRGLDGLTAEVAAQQHGPMNTIAWMVGHLAWHEQLSWLTRAQGITPRPELNELTANGKPRSNPPLDEMLAAWHQVTAAADAWLDGLTPADLAVPMGRSRIPQSVGTALLRMTYHYFVHCGEGSAVRQLAEGGELPEFVGDIQVAAPWRPEPAELGGDAADAGPQPAGSAS